MSSIRKDTYSYPSPCLLWWWWWTDLWAPVYLTEKTIHYLTCQLQLTIKLYLTASIKLGYQSQIIKCLWQCWLCEEYGWISLSLFLTQCNQISVDIWKAYSYTAIIYSTIAEHIYISCPWWKALNSLYFPWKVNIANLGQNYHWLCLVWK